MEISSDLTLFKDKINLKCRCLQRLSTVVVVEVADRTTLEEEDAVVVEEVEEDMEALIAAKILKTEIKK